jgi:hypothetical protein
MAAETEVRGRDALGQPVAWLNLNVKSREEVESVESCWREEDFARGWLAFQAAQTL